MTENTETTRMFLARHGQTAWNDQSRYTGQTDIELTDVGRRQAKALGDRFSDIDIDTVYASPLVRTRRTAEIVSDPHGLSVTVRDALKERSYGELEGEPKERGRRIRAELGVDKSEWTPPNGENRRDVANRVCPCIELIAGEHPSKTVVVVAHGGVNKTIIPALASSNCMWGHRLQQDNTGVNVFEHDGDWSILRVNDISHL